MILLAALLSAIGSDRCAAISACPTDGELKQAIRNREAEFIFSAQAQAQKDSPGDIVMMTPHVLRRVFDIYCEQPRSGEADVVRCKFAADRGSEIEYYSARLTRTGDGWRIEDAR